MDEKRRLPSWMIRKPVKVETKYDEEEEVSVVMECTKPKAKRVARVKDECLASDGDSFLVKCGTKRKKRGLVDKDVVECRDLEKDDVVEKRKRGRKDGERGASRKKKGKDCELDSGIEIQRLSSDEEEDDDELSMEDMLMIAKEFVEKDESGKGQQQPSERQCELKKKSSHIFSSVMPRTSVIAPQDTRTHQVKEAASHRDSVENTSEVTISDFKMTDDPAQDMLDLFLGPLLNKPIRKEETSSIKDVVVTREITSQKHTTTTTYPIPPGQGMGTSQKHDPVISDKPITFAKKKSSLRDAVAMLLES